MYAYNPTVTNKQPLDNVPESEKLSLEWLVTNMNYSIYACKNPYLQEDIIAYNYMNGLRNINDFEYLTKAYGIEFPAKLTHIPLVKTYLDELIGEERSLPLTWKVAPRDIESLVQMKDNKVHAVMEQLVQAATENINNRLQHFSTPQEQRGTEPSNSFDTQELKAIKEFSKYSWKDAKIIAADIVLRHLQYKLDIMRKKNMMFRDLLITGRSFYRCYARERGMDPELWICNPMHMYMLGNEEVYYLKDCERVCYREWLTVTDVINKYGHQMGPQEQSDLMSRQGKIIWSGVQVYDAVFTGKYLPYTTAYTGADLLEICHCEWKSNTKYMFVDEKEIDEEMEKQMTENNEKDKITYRYRMDLYRGIRIGGNIYVGMGKVKDVVRPMDNPSYVGLTFNGVLFNKRNSRPYSLVLATKDLQDKYDILNYFIENHFALSGTKGTTVVLENIPKDFGNNVTDRLIKFIYYKKMGLNVVSLSQEGSKENFSNYSNFDDTISEAVRVIIEMMQYCETMASRIVGVPPQRAGVVEKNQLVGNNEMAINQSTLTTKPVFACHNDLVRQMMIDTLNVAKESWKYSKKKVFVLGDELSEIFTLDTDSFSETDYDILLSDSGVELKQIEELKQLAESMISSNLLNASMVVDIVTIDNVTQLKNKIKDATEEQKNDIVAKMKEEITKLQQGMQQMNKQNQEMVKKDRELEQRKLDIEEKKVEQDGNMRDKKIMIDQQLGQEKNEIEKDSVNLQSLQYKFSEQSKPVKKL